MLVQKTIQMSNTPAWVDYQILSELLEDETQLFQLGKSEERRFHTYNKEDMPVSTSAWINFPTAENPRTRYKHASVVIKVNPDQKKTSRQTYSMLDWIGDIGGLYDGLNVIGALLIKPIAYFAMNTKLATLLVRLKGPSSKLKKKKPKDNLVDRITSDLTTNRFLLKPQRSYFLHLFCQRCQSRRRYDRIVRAALAKIEKELDL